MSKLLGYKKGISTKNGNNNPYCIMHISSDFNPREKSDGAVGQKCENIFLPSELVDLLKPSDIGHDVVLDYTVSGGRAFLNNVTVK